MNRQELIYHLTTAIQRSDTAQSDTVTLPKEDAMEIASLLFNLQDAKLPRTRGNGQVEFYCMDCSRSFWALAQEDTECFEKWHYHRWVTHCPYCKAEVMQNDRYWR